MMKILLDDDQHEQPTFLNIVEAFKSLSEQSQPGDVVFIQFSGHGGRILDAPIDPQTESYDEVLVPCDYVTHGLIRDTLIFKTLLAPMRYGVTVTIIIDCCDTGMMVDLPYSFSTRNDRRSDSVNRMTMNPDFSFVRFLKVVKTLYESSTFTQLGKTVGTALGNQQVLEEMYGEEEEGTADSPTHNSGEEINMVKTEDQQSGTIFQQLCMSPKDEDTESKKKSGRERKSDGLALLEQVLGCNFLMTDIADDVSGEGTFENATFEEHSTFDSMSDSEGRKRSGRARSRRHR